MITGKPEDLIKKVQPGTEIFVVAAVEKGNGEVIDNPNPAWAPGTRYDLPIEAYGMLDDINYINQLNMLLNETDPDNPDFMLIPHTVMLRVPAE